MTDRMEITGAGHNTTLLADIAAFPRVLRAKVGGALRALQLARMQSILSQMSDYQLAQVGVKRSQIADFAATLMARDSDH